MIRRIIKKCAYPFLRVWLHLFYHKARKYRFGGVEVLVHPEVFPPHMTMSTRILLDYLRNFPLEKKTFLELGCGSGIISLYAAKCGADVTATDINETALRFLETAKKKNALEVEVLHSDLFSCLKGRWFDYIVINPPYYPRAYASVKEQAWFCGEDFQYFRALFSQLPAFCGSDRRILMILSEDCELEKIESLAAENGVFMRMAQEIKKPLETNFIFDLTCDVA